MINYKTEAYIWRLRNRLVDEWQTWRMIFYLSPFVCNDEELFYYSRVIVERLERKPEARQASRISDRPSYQVWAKDLLV